MTHCKTSTLLHRCEHATGHARRAPCTRFVGSRLCKPHMQSHTVPAWSPSMPGGARRASSLSNRRRSCGLPPMHPHGSPTAASTTASGSQHTFLHSRPLLHRTSHRPRDVRASCISPRAHVPQAMTGAAALCAPPASGHCALHWKQRMVLLFRSTSASAGGSCATALRVSMASSKQRGSRRRWLRWSESHFETLGAQRVSLASIPLACGHLHHLEAAQRTRVLVWLQLPVARHGVAALARRAVQEALLPSLAIVHAVELRRGGVGAQHAGASARMRASARTDLSAMLVPHSPHRDSAARRTRASRDSATLRKWRATLRSST